MITYYSFSKKSSIVFDLQDTKCEFKDDNVDIHFVGDANYSEQKNSKIKIYLGIFNNEENYIKKFLDKNLNCYFLTNMVDNTVKDDRIIFIDFCVNLTKTYYTLKDFKNLSSYWYYAGNDCYILQNLNFVTPRKNIFLALNNTYRDYLHARPVIMNYLSKHKDKGYLGDASNKDMFLKSEGNPNTWSNYQPVANEFYNDSYLSIYGETIEFGSSMSITEKTLEPLIKGHFILPFSTNGFIQNLKDYGFKLPNFINYEYDQEEDYKHRYYLYHQEMKRLVNLPLNEWQKYYFDNKEIISYNRDLILNKPFHKVNFEGLLAHSSVG